MGLSENELYSAMKWRGKQISFFQRIVETARLDKSLSAPERQRICHFATVEIAKLNIASDMLIISYYHDYRKIIETMLESDDFAEEDVVVMASP